MLQNVGRQDSGEYICSATNNMGTTKVTITLDVESECLYFHCCFCSHFSESVWVCVYYGFKVVLQSIVNLLSFSSLVSSSSVCHLCA